MATVFNIAATILLCFVFFPLRLPVLWFRDVLEEFSSNSIILSRSSMTMARVGCSSIGLPASTSISSHSRRKDETRQIRIRLRVSGSQDSSSCCWFCFSISDLVLLVYDGLAVSMCCGSGRQNKGNRSLLSTVEPGFSLLGPGR